MTLYVGGCYSVWCAICMHTLCFLQLLVLCSGTCTEAQSIDPDTMISHLIRWHSVTCHMISEWCIFKMTVANSVLTMFTDWIREKRQSYETLFSIRWYSLDTRICWIARCWLLELKCSLLIPLIRINHYTCFSFYDWTELFNFYLHRTICLVLLVPPECFIAFGYRFNILFICF